jgi:hypothetical protein
MGVLSFAKTSIGSVPTGCHHFQSTLICYKSTPCFAYRSFFSACASLPAFPQRPSAGKPSSASAIGGLQAAQATTRLDRIDRLFWVAVQLMCWMEEIAGDRHT